jgi:hypothetical protein
MNTAFWTGKFRRESHIFKSHSGSAVGANCPFRVGGGRNHLMLRGSFINTPVVLDFFAIFLFAAFA